MGNTKGQKPAQGDPQHTITTTKLYYTTHKYTYTHTITTKNSVYLQHAYTIHYTFSNHNKFYLY